MAIGVGKNAYLPVMHGAGSREVLLRVDDRYLKRCVTDTGWLHIYEHKQSRWPPKLGRSFVKCYWRDGSKLFRPAVHVIIHRITAQLENTLCPHGIGRLFGGTFVNRHGFQIGGERGSSWIN